MAVRIGIVGCSGLGRVHAQNFLDVPGVEVTAVCDLLPAARRSVADHVRETSGGQVPAEFDDVDRMLDEGDLDGVSLILPHHLHYPIGVKALEAGLHVLMEKPMVTEVDHAVDLAARVAKAGKVLNIAFQGPHTAQGLTTRKLLDDGVIGEVRFVHASVFQDWLGIFDKHPQKKWRLQKSAAGGGQMYDTGSHLINIMLWTTRLTPQRVWVEIDKAGEEVDVNSALTVRFTNGAIASLSILGGTQVKSMDARMSITGTRGDIQLTRVTHGGPEPELIQRTAETKQIIPLLDGTTPQASFIAAIRGEAEPLCGPDWGVRLASFMDAVYRAAETGHPQDVTPDATGD